MMRSFGPDGNDYMEIWDIRLALEQVPHRDFLCFDACLMASVEALYELKDQADYFIASPTEIMGSGFPYNTVIPVLGKPELDLEGVCKAYMEYYRGLSSEGSISLIKADKLQTVAEAYKEVYPLYPEDSYVYFGLIQGFGRYINSSSNYQHTFFDILDTAKKLSLQENTALISAVEDAVIYKDNTEKFISITINTTQGIMVYIS